MDDYTMGYDDEEQWMTLSTLNHSSSSNETVYLNDLGLYCLREYLDSMMTRVMTLSYPRKCCKSLICLFSICLSSEVSMSVCALHCVFVYTMMDCLSCIKMSVCSSGASANASLCARVSVY